MGIFLPAIQYFNFFCCRCGEPNATFYCATLSLCHSATPILLHPALPRLPDCTPVHRDAAYMNACNKVNATRQHQSSARRRAGDRPTGRMASPRRQPSSRVSTRPNSGIIRLEVR